MTTPDPHTWPTPTAQTLAEALRAQTETEQEQRLAGLLRDEEER